MRLIKRRRKALGKFSGAEKRLAGVI